MTKKKSYKQLLKEGALGNGFYNEIKALDLDDVLIEFTKKFIESLYPIRFIEFRGTYHLSPEIDKIDFYLEVFKTRMKYGEDFIVDCEVMPYFKMSNEVDKPPKLRIKEEVRLLRSQGFSVDEIMKELDLSKSAVYRMCAGMELNKTKRSLLTILEDGAEWKAKELFAMVGGPKSSFNRHLKDLVNESLIIKIKQGVYTQKVY